MDLCYQMNFWMQVHSPAWWLCRKQCCSNPALLLIIATLLWNPPSSSVGAKRQSCRAFSSVVFLIILVLFLSFAGWWLVSGFAWTLCALNWRGAEKCSSIVFKPSRDSCVWWMVKPVQCATLLWAWQWYCCRNSTECRKFCSYHDDLSGGENKKINKIKKRAELHFSFVIKIRSNPVKFKLIQLNHLSFLISLL